MTVAAATAVIAAIAAPATAMAASPGSAAPVAVVVREAAATGSGPERAVTAFGGSVVRELGVIGGFSAKVPADRLDALRAVPGVKSVTEDAGLTLSSTDVEDQAAQAGSRYTVANQVTGASSLWDAGYTGKGVDVAVIDSGVAPVAGLSASGKVVYGPDLTVESSTPAKDLDTYGHGTHMAGIIAGRDAAPTGGDSGNFEGMAPDARIVSLKVADSQGRTDVSQAIAAIDWVVQNHDKNGLNVRVLNLSFGTDGVQDYTLDPLTYAVEQAWQQGIVVVVAAGNDGNTSGKLNNPAYDPFVIAVGGDSAQGTRSTADDSVPSWSNTGDGARNPDVVAPGAKIVSLRTPGSYLDSQYPAARVGERFFRGSGTSQAAAVVSGAAALLVSQRPGITPDQVKALLTGTAQSLPNTDVTAQGHGLIDLAAAKSTPTPSAVQTFTAASGRGSVEAARGSVHLVVNGKAVTGEVDVRGQKFDSVAVAKGMKARSNWGALTSSGVTWSGVTWSGVTWSGVTWSGVTWSGVTWSGVTWSGVTWSGVTWSGVTWSGVTWSGVTWSGVTWSGVTWSAADWA